jgi:hypothetical protein
VSTVTGTVTVERKSTGVKRTYPAGARLLAGDL